MLHLKGNGCVCHILHMAETNEMWIFAFEFFAEQVFALSGCVFNLSPPKEHSIFCLAQSPEQPHFVILV